MSHFRGMVCLSLLLVPCPVAVATSPSDAATAPTRAPSEGERGGVTGEVEAAVRAWLRASHEALAEEKALRGRKMTWQMTLDAVEPESALKMARTRLANGAASPEDLQRIQTTERRRREGPDILPYTVWYIDENHWRLNHEALYASKDLAFLDSAMNGTATWMRTPRDVRFGDPTRTIHRAVTPTSWLSNIRDAYRLLIAAGVLEMGEHADTCVVGRQPDGDLVITRVLPNASRSELTVRPLSGAGFRPVRSRILPGAGSSLGANIDFIEVRSHPLVGREIATHIRYTLLGGSEPYSYEYQLIALESVPEEQIRPLLETPSPTRVDPLRPESRVEQVFDLHAMDPTKGPIASRHDHAARFPPPRRLDRDGPQPSGFVPVAPPKDPAARSGASELEQYSKSSWATPWVQGTLTMLAGAGVILLIRAFRRN